MAKVFLFLFYFLVNKLLCSLIRHVGGDDDDDIVSHHMYTMRKPRSVGLY